MPVGLAFGFLVVPLLHGQVAEPPPVLESLRNRVVPEPANLGEFIKDRSAAIALGKALFWDSQVGSDSITACASCHFHAGADNRSKNQLSPGLLVAPMDKSFQVGGPNHTLKTTDFPFHKLRNVNDRKSIRLRSFNDVVSSQGVILESFEGLDEFNEEIRTLKPDPVFKVSGLNVRRVEPRNTPTVINAVFNARNFWDGRAQAVFNGVNPFGLRDSELDDSDVSKAFVWKEEEGWLVEVRVALDNSSLASQAVGPPLSAFEMSAAGRRFPELGRKLLDRRALANQEVHPQDSVLGTLIDPQTRRVTGTYRDLIKAAFHEPWWGSELTVPAEDAPPAEPTPDTVETPWLGSKLTVLTGGLSVVEASADTAGLVNLSSQLNQGEPARSPRPEPTGWSQMEANFSLYFGLALQLYQSTLVSDQTPYDRYAEGNQNALTAVQKLGLNMFLTKGQCVNCHGGPEFTNASVAHARQTSLERMLMGNQQQAVYDIGFYNIGVRPTSEDLGVGGQDPFGNPLSEARLAKLRGREVFNQLTGRYPNLEVSPAERVAANGAFKTSTLRNIELTAPYFHNGGTRTLREVVDFYNRGGDFFDQNIADVDADLSNLGLTNTEKEALVAFMKALTDERVRYRRAPFDHPALYIPNGQQGDAVAVINDGSGAAMDTFTLLPATGRNGGVPFRNFLE